MAKLRSLSSPFTVLIASIAIAVVAFVAISVCAPQTAHAASLQAATKGPFVGTWTGSYDGYDSNVKVKRKIKMEVNEQTADKFWGRITITSESACWYLFEGTYDSKTKTCTFEGTEWLQNSSNFYFVQFTGKLSMSTTSTIRGTCDGDSERTFNLKQTSSKPPSYGQKVSKLRRVWKGEYDGFSGDTVVRRDYVLKITSYSAKTGAIKGTGYIKPSAKANKYYAVNGSYKFSGTFDKNTGLIRLQGHKWIQYPVGESTNNFEFVALKGYLDSTGTKISGMSEDGIWRMSATAESKLFGNVKTSQDYRYPAKYKKTQEAYPALANLTNITTYGMPGLSSSSSMVGSTNQMVPQGICVAKNYILITAYAANEKYCSVIYVLSKKTGKLLKTLETSDANHVGGIAFDGRCVYVARSTQNQVGVIDYSTIAAAVKKKGNVVTINYAKTIDVYQTASFITYYKNRLWVGYCNTSSKSKNQGYINGYEISGKKASDITLNTWDNVCIGGLPNSANGADFAKVNGEVRLAVNVSLGRKYDSTRYVYDVDVKNGTTNLLFKQMQPPMMEESCVSGGKTYTIFESAATKYSTTQSGKPCKYIVDRICVGETAKLFSTVPGTYATVGSGNSAASYLIKNNREISYAAPSPFNTAKSLVIPDSGKIGPKTRTVSGIRASAFAYAAKAKTLTVKTTALTSGTVKNSLKGSKVGTVVVPGNRLKTYKQAFAKENSGKKVTVKALSSLNTSAVRERASSQVASPLTAAAW